jgi:hydrogenase nickel incorporation protein HypA/HybF
MHELSIAHSILSIAEKSFPAGTKGYISSVTLQIGELSGVEIDSLMFAFESIKDDTLLYRATLDIDVVRGEALCSDCGTTFHMPSFGTACPACGSYLAGIQAGKEMRVVSLSVEE